MSRKGEGCQWEQPGFSVFMHNTDEKINKCLRCKKSEGQPNQKCKPCKFEDRGYVLNIRKG